MVNGAVDTAMTGAPIYDENVDKVQPVFWVRDVMSADMMQTVLVTTKEYAASHGDVLRNLVAARREGVKFIQEHTDEAAEITARAYNGDPVLYKTVFHTLLGINYWSDGRLDYR